MNCGEKSLYKTELANENSRYYNKNMNTSEIISFKRLIIFLRVRSLFVRVNVFIVVSTIMLKSDPFCQLWIAVRVSGRGRTLVIMTRAIDYGSNYDPLRNLPVLKLATSKIIMISWIFTCFLIAGPVKSICIIIFKKNRDLVRLKNWKSWHFHFLIYALPALNLFQLKLEEIIVDIFLGVPIFFFYWAYVSNFSQFFLGTWVWFQLMRPGSCVLEKGIVIAQSFR